MTTIALPRERRRPRVDVRAARDILPVALAVLPFATVLGVALGALAVPAGPALVASGLVYAGSAQLAAMTALDEGVVLLGAVGVATLINARLLLYGAAMAGRFAGQPTWFRWLGPLVLVDQTYATASAGAPDEPSSFRRYWLTAGAVLGVIYLTGIGLGMGLGAVVPPHPALGMAVPCTFLALLAPKFTDPRARRVALVAAGVAVAGRALPAGLGIVLAIMVGVAAAPRHEKETS
ncbi:AzlC family ABC transporter permease [Egicoccus sp. AB-alg2]|uniref:AzlC family ABC transporter permease n=1 Tax=Egicoccus sp. AB-alg2 TaxID=3242693 RepID=UPI00359D7736